MRSRIGRELLMITATLALAATILAGSPASADPAGGVGPLTYGCPGFPGSPSGGVCLYEPTWMEPRYGTFHSHKRSDGSAFNIPYLVGFIDVNSTATTSCGGGVRFYDVTYPGGVWTKEYLFTVYDNTNNGYSGYIVPGSLQARIDRAEYNC